MQVTKTICGIVHLQTPDWIVRSVGRKLELSTDNGDSFEQIGKLNLGFSRNVASIHRLGSRLTRANVKHCVPVGDETLLVFAGKSIFHANLSTRDVEQVSRIKGSRPLRICVQDNKIFYGEYRSNPERTSIHVFVSRDQGRTWDVAYEFQKIRHIHGIFNDPLDNSIWITTGDYHDEAAIWNTKDNFRTVTPILQGNQQSRVIDILFDNEDLLFGTDAPDEQNFLYRMTRDGIVQPIEQVSGPIFHAAKIGDRHFFSTAREPSQFNTTNELTAWCIESGCATPIAHYKKDSWSMKYFQYGQIMFPELIDAEQLRGIWMSPFATNQDHSSQYFQFQVMNS